MTDDHARVLPINAPARAELLRRNQLALSVLAHRPYTRATAELLGRVLR
ncbi:hypothetical protein [Saccharopolyspora spinosa]|uniref:Uncharacterized protein n=1 Tax=Saccharopolyspora spinosa TaxID=60894 RepID=A0A2N3XZ41_SACSN|nr:hypothetical protein [Saccharopolyspora spinosa]PKW15953.1 hypothetical protein A8926_3735 [Saccharopolyspora spinosa]